MKNKQLSFDDFDNFMNPPENDKTKNEQTDAKSTQTDMKEDFHGGEIKEVEYSEVMQKSYLDYSMSVITSRAIPDVRDGLKPVQRRIIYDMDELGVGSDKPYRKSARIVGDTMGKYHPHGDASIYDAQVVMAQDFKKRVPLIDGHGNYGSIEGDGSAAMRYTEARLQKFTEDVFLADLSNDTVDFVPNYDETEQEPSVLPCRVPHVLLNGSDGIAVGMTTSVPPHNLNDVIDTAVYALEHPKADSGELLEILHGPDFPTGGIVCNKNELPDIYAAGTGKIKLRGKIKFEKGNSRQKDQLIITEIPYTMIGDRIGKFLESVADLVENKTLPDISNIINQSSDNIRIVLELKKNADVEYIKNVLYKKTNFEDTFSFNMLVISHNKPEVLSLQGYMAEFIRFQYEITTRKYHNLLGKAEKKKEIQEGLIKAVDIIDLIIEILRGSKNITQAKKCLINGDTEGIAWKSKASEKQAKKLNFTEAQATAILEMKLSRLIGLEIEALKKDYEKLLKTIAEYQRILGSKTVMRNLLKKEMLAVKAAYGTPRKTIITNKKEAVIVEKEEEERDMMLLIDQFNYIHSVDMDAYERNIRNDENNANLYRHMIRMSNKDKLLLFTDAGFMHSVKAQDIPAGKFKDKGSPLDNLCNLDSTTEQIVYMTAEKQTQSLIFVASDGLVKKVSSQEFNTKNRTIQATKLKEGQRVVCVGEYTDGYVVLTSDDGFCLKFKQGDIPETKRNAAGAIGMKMKQGEHIVAAELLTEDQRPEISLSKRAKRGKRYQK